MFKNGLPKNLLIKLPILWKIFTCCILFISKMFLTKNLFTGKHYFLKIPFIKQIYLLKIFLIKGATYREFFFPKICLFAHFLAKKYILSKTFLDIHNYFHRKNVVGYRLVNEIIYSKIDYYMRQPAIMSVLVCLAANEVEKLFSKEWG